MYTSGAVADLSYREMQPMQKFHYHCCYKHQHWCHICIAFMITWLMSVISYVTQICTYIPYMPAKCMAYIINAILQVHLFLSHILH